MKKEFLLGLKFNPLTLNEAAEVLISDAQRGLKRSVVTPNVDHVIRAKKDSFIRGVFNSCQYHFVDGMPLVWMSRWLCSEKFPERVSGVDLFEKVCELSVRDNTKIYLLGAEESVLKKTIDKLEDDFQGIDVVGSFSPPVGFENNVEANQLIIEKINTSSADIVFLALGAPKQEIWMHDHISFIDRGVLIGVGAAFDLYSGKFRRAPKWVQNVSFEWLWRLFLEPKRLWRRYILDDLRIVPYFISEVFFNRK
jgi:N-acetylglucosaminyldiphosphoundecaprenol N-acetyl-beta-D-mannosaminyltransferase